jgi:hypothetical protein
VRPDSPRSRPRFRFFFEPTTGPGGPRRGDR